ncbi:MAG: PAS domain S-box protein [Flavobacteriales bacterium]|nr:PAS domain S-box protein [Flavobacteriales bacterium]MCB9167071.1 PAS domain S-box protein [Flavobacteriales bacterium]
MKSPRQRSRKLDAEPSIEKLQDDLVVEGLSGAFRATMDGRLVECNIHMAGMLGHPSIGSLVNAPLTAIYAGPAEREDFLERLGERGTLVAHEMTLRHCDGGPVHVLVNARIVRRSGSEAVIEGVLMDVSAARRNSTGRGSRSAADQWVPRQASGAIVITLNDQVVHADPAGPYLKANKPGGTALLVHVHPDDRDRVRRYTDRALAGETIDPFDMRIMAADGHPMELSVRLFLMEYEGQDALQWTLNAKGGERTKAQENKRAQVAEEVNSVLRREIKEHRRTQKELIQAKQFAKSIVDSSLDMIIAVDEAGCITEFNPAATLKFGYESQEVLGRVSDMLYADKAEYERIQDELNSHGAFAGEVRNVDRDGKEFTVFLAASRLFGPDGKLLGSMGVSRDVTRAKRDREALSASEERYRDLFENATDLVQIVSADGRFQFVNAAWRKTLGYSDPELRELTIWDLVHPDELEHCRRVFAVVMSGEVVKNLRTVFVAKDGAQVHVRGNTNARTVDGEVVSTRSIFHDITREELAEAQLQEHAAKLRALFESGEHMFWTVDERLALTSFNQGYADMITRLYGTRPEINRDAGRPRKRFASDAYHRFWEEKYQEAFKGNTLRFETEVKDKEGNHVSNEIFLSPVYAANGRVAEVFGIGHEITEKKRAERVVRDQAARLAAIFSNSANMMVWTMDSDFRITALNDHFQRSITNMYNIELAPGSAFLEELSGYAMNKKRRQITDHYKAAMDGRPQQFQVELRDPSGGSIWLENFLNPIVIDGRVREISCLAYDITDKMTVEAELRESLHEKEVLLKEVHHRVKNNLQIISSILNLQTSYVGKDQRMLDLLRESQDRIRSMSFIHESLYQTKDFSSIDLANYVDRLSRNLVMSYSVSGTVELETDLERVLLGLDQAIPCGLILNELISNALKHAFPNERQGRIRVGVHAEDRRIRVEVSDNGVGLPEDFDDERDANLGLQLVHTLVDQLDATLERPKGRGARYFLTFERIK